MVSGQSKCVIRWMTALRALFYDGKIIKHVQFKAEYLKDIVIGTKIRVVKKCYCTCPSDSSFFVLVHFNSNDTLSEQALNHQHRLKYLRMCEFEDLT